MKRLTAIAALALCLLPAIAQDEMPLHFTPVSEEPVVAHTRDRNAFDGRFTDPGAVLVHDGVFHMFRNGFQTWPGVVDIEHLTSADGVTWTAAPAGPIIESADVPYSEVAALASSALVEDDGTWVLYIYTHESMSGPAASRIGRLTAPAPEGPWTADPEAVLNPGPARAWDSGGVSAPRVLKTDMGYVMYYSGSNSAPQSGIGMATSPDGITWTKYDDPMTTDELFAESDPLLLGDNQTGIHQPIVFQTDDGYLMFYRTFRIGRMGSMLVHAAVSEDGIAWTPLQDDPVWDGTTIGNLTSGFWFTAAAELDGTYYLYVEEGSMGGTDIFAGTLALE
jgi:predicted GH43/DUF377 family glycosyl hydrolase